MALQEDVGAHRLHAEHLCPDLQAHTRNDNKLADLQVHSEQDMMRAVEEVLEETALVMNRLCQMEDPRRRLSRPHHRCRESGV